MRDRTDWSARFAPGRSTMRLPPSTARRALAAAGMLVALFVSSERSGAQDSPDERRCTGQWRAGNEERIASCTSLIDSGRYQPPNLAIIFHDRGVAQRAKGDLAAALK